MDKNSRSSNETQTRATTCGPRCSSMRYERVTPSPTPSRYEPCGAAALKFHLSFVHIRQVACGLPIVRNYKIRNAWVFVKIDFQKEVVTPTTAIE